VNRALGGFEQLLHLGPLPRHVGVEGLQLDQRAVSSRARSLPA
jgi:hypothetical protein